MARRTFAIGDIHGDLEALTTLMPRLGPLRSEDTLVFIGDYIDRGPDSAGVVRYLMELPDQIDAQVVFLRGNHEDGWLRALGGNWPQFVLPVNNGCLQAMDSFLGRPVSPPGTTPSAEDFEAFLTGSFFPPEVIEWMENLRWWYEDEHAIYVHAGLAQDDDGNFLHPSAATGDKRTAMLWLRDKKFFRDYDGKLVVFGHTVTDHLPPELSSYTPDDPEDMWAGPACVGIDTGAGKGGFLTVIEFPARLVYESRDPQTP